MRTLVRMILKMRTLVESSSTREPYQRVVISDQVPILKTLWRSLMPIDNSPSGSDVESNGASNDDKVSEF